MPTRKKKRTRKPDLVSTIRMTTQLRNKLARAAKVQQRSINSEMNVRLQNSFA